MFTGFVSHRGGQRLIISTEFPMHMGQKNIFKGFVCLMDILFSQE